MVELEVHTVWIPGLKNRLVSLSYGDSSRVFWYTLRGKKLVRVQDATMNLREWKLSFGTVLKQDYSQQSGLTEKQRETVSEDIADDKWVVNVLARSLWKDEIEGKSRREGVEIIEQKVHDVLPGR